MMLGGGWYMMLGGGWCEYMMLGGGWCVCSFLVVHGQARFVFTQPCKV